MTRISSRRYSIERTLPLLISGLLLVTTGALAWAAYARARHVLLVAAGPRLKSAATTINVLLARSVSVYAAQLTRAAGDPAISTFLTTGRDEAAARHALARVWVGEPEARGRVELRRADGSVVLDTTLGGAPGGAQWATRSMAGASPSDTAARIGPIEVVRDTVCYEGIAPVVSRGIGRSGIAGYIADLRVLTGSNVQTVRDLIGPRSTMLLGSPTTGVWSDLTGRAEAPPAGVATGNPLAFAQTGQAPAVGVAAVVPGAPWMLWVEQPQSVVLDPMRPLLVDIVGLATMIILVGACGAWLVSRHITRPIVAVTDAAERVAAGRHESDRTAVGRDEVARLAEAFERMAHRVEDALATAERARADAEAQKHEAVALAEELEQQVEETQSLSEELEQSNEQLQQSVIQAETANKAKFDFLARMSHELRTPLNAIGGYVQLLDMQVAGPVVDEQREYLARIARAGGVLLGRINDILNFAKIDSGTLVYALRTVAVHDALTEAIGVVQPLLAHRVLTYDHASADRGVTVMADREKLEQILLNLLSNAAKFTSPGGRIAVAFTVNADTVDITVTDTGIGIPADKLAIIFEPFVQVNPALTREQGGTGLGLAISRELAWGMGGDLTVTSTERTGSTFVLTLPRTAIDGSDAGLADAMESESAIER